MPLPDFLIVSAIALVMIAFPTLLIGMSAYTATPRVRARKRAVKRSKLRQTGSEALPV